MSTTAVAPPRLGAVESFVPVAHAIQWVGTNLDQIAAWWVGIELPMPRLNNGTLGIWCNPSPNKTGFYAVQTTDWIVYWAGRVQILTALGYEQFKQGHRAHGASSGVSEGR